MKTIEWAEIWQEWQERELPVWQEHWEKEGFKSWEDWRRDSLEKYGFEGLEKLRWERLELEGEEQIAEVVPNIVCGPYKGWAIYHPEGIPGVLTFRELAEHPLLQKNERVRAIQKAIEEPVTRTVIALKREDGCLVLVDGHHTLSAFALNILQQKPIFADLVVYIAKPQ